MNSRQVRPAAGGSAPKPPPLDPELISLMSLVKTARHADVERAARRILGRRPGQPLAVKALAFALIGLGRFEEALPILEHEVRRNAHDPELHNNLGIVLSALMRWDESLTCFAAAHSLAPDDPEVLKNYGAALFRMHRWNDAVPWLLKAIERHPGDYVEAIHMLAAALNNANRYDEAWACYRELAAGDASNLSALYSLVGIKLRRCDWEGLEQQVRALLDRSADFSDLAASPFAALAIPGLTGAQHRNLAARHAAGIIPREPLLPAPAARERAGRRLRVGYLSGDFRNHPVGACLAELLERHDRANVEIHGYSSGPQDESPLATRLRGACEHFRDIAETPVREAVAAIRADGLDILVDLAGWTANGRPELLGLRCAPVQVNWLGYPGTLGVAACDYILGDPVTTPMEHAPHYAERIAQLPRCYLPADATRAIGPRPTRAAMGLPDDAFVFSSFNNSYKFNPPTFDLWCRLLRDLPGSVLWLSSPSETGERRLGDELERRGVARERLVFAKRVESSADHLARLGLADLALDTAPYNSHSTGIDSLWAGVPFVTCIGETFASRVGASLLHAAGLDQLVTASTEDYHALALRLATCRDELAGLRSGLARQRERLPLFDMQAFAGSLERMYERMHAAVLANAPVPLPAEGA